MQLSARLRDMEANNNKSTTKQFLAFVFRIYPIGPAYRTTCLPLYSHILVHSLSLSIKTYNIPNTTLISTRVQDSCKNAPRSRGQYLIKQINKIQYTASPHHPHSRPITDTTSLNSSSGSPPSSLISSPCISSSPPSPSSAPRKHNARCSIV